tara:strand:- start:2391 stop:2597 length:207 start_codon:yes stop_codon:yes gene_type:complete
MNSHLSNEELLGRIVALEEKVKKSRLLMKRPGSDDYEKLVDVVCDQERRIKWIEQDIYPPSEPEEEYW